MPQADERTIATSIMMLFNYGGVSMGFVLGPLLVPANGAKSRGALPSPPPCQC